jgi:hypothetical protein
VPQRLLSESGQFPNGLYSEWPGDFDQCKSTVAWGWVLFPLPPPRICAPLSCRGASSHADSALVLRATFLPHHADPSTHLEPSDLHLQRNKINSTKLCLFFLLFAPRRACCGSQDPEWVIKAIWWWGEGDLRSLHKQKGVCHSTLKGGEGGGRGKINDNKDCLTQL